MEPKLVHIHAKCNAFEIFEVVEEPKSFSRLRAIKKLFLWSDKRDRKGAGQLTVNTVIVNPTLFSV